eukprot:gene9655-17416_t
MQALLKLHSCPNEDTEQLGKIFDSVTIHVRELELLGTPPESYGNLVLPVSKDITLQVTRKISDDNRDINEILEIIGRELDANEISATVAASKRTGKALLQRPPSGTTQSFVASGGNKVTCYFCKGPHYSYKCHKITDVKERKDIILKAKRCFNCMGNGHFLKDCKSSRNCIHCKGRHHQSICTSKNEAQEESASESNSVTATAKKKGSVMLQTATAYVYGENKNDKTKVRILLDNGSTQSYVTEELRHKLSLKTERKDETLNLNTIGSNK